MPRIAMGVTLLLSIGILIVVTIMSELYKIPAYIIILCGVFFGSTAFYSSVKIYKEYYHSIKKTNDIPLNTVLFERFKNLKDKITIINDKKNNLEINLNCLVI